ncbi:long-chain-fatty-acid--CoA ligase [Geodermatophilus sp. CPCC 206100]|uniref:long-chain-fatty-acid--CoA ligase n=1 Tax=Geodermatophilus sp. CPCC 206100 TaxID=3020054 RepID=UPI003B00AC4E
MHQSLDIAAILRRAEQFAPGREVVSRRPDRSLQRTTYAELGRRSRQLASALLGLGLEPGARVATLLWTQAEHWEVYYAAPIAGLVTHPLNPRLHADDIAYIADDAGDEVLVVDESFLGLYDLIQGRTPFRHVVVVGAAPEGLLSYEELLAGGDPEWQPGELDEWSTALVTYTSGTTGRPKGVEVSHRAIAVHALSSALGGWLAITDSDVVLPVVPMFHALAWGWPYTAALLGAKQVLPGRFLDPASLLELIAGERVTLTGGVPTVWMGLLTALDAEPGVHDTSSLRAVLSGGATAPPAMIEGLRQRHGVPLVHTWGMTELVMGAIANLTVELQEAPEEEQRRHRYAQGLPMPFLEVRARGDAGLVPWDGRSLGELEVRGPWVAREYLANPQASAEQWTDDGWFRTGDVVAITPHGYISIQDRAKDLVKSGGEWISTPELENALMDHPAVAEAAVIAVADEKWTERPLAVVSFKSGASATPEELREFIAPKVARWWLPERVEFVEAIPKTAVGKYNKIALREQFDSTRDPAAPRTDRA